MFSSGGMRADFHSRNGMSMAYSRPGPNDFLSGRHQLVYSAAHYLGLEWRQLWARAVLCDAFWSFAASSVSTCLLRNSRMEWHSLLWRASRRGDICGNRLINFPSRDWTDEVIWRTCTRLPRLQSPVRALPRVAVDSSRSLHVPWLWHRWLLLVFCKYDSVSIITYLCANSPAA